MHGFCLTAAARNDLLEIGRHTEEKWGRQQRDDYLRQLDDAFKLLARQPGIGKLADGIKPGYRKFPQGSHIIFYRAEIEIGIIIVRILHNSMDVERRL